MAQNALFYYSGSLLDGANPLEVGPLNADENEVSSWFKITVKTPDGFETYGNTTITPTDSTSVDKWRIAPDDAGSPGTPLDWGAVYTITSTIDDTTGVDFHVQARAVSGESAGTDTSVSFVASGTVVEETIS